jgi:hypothetical protein
VTGEFHGLIHLTYLYTEMRAGVPVPWFRYRLDPTFPLTLILDDGRYLRPAGSGTTDFGSVPAGTQSIVGPLEYAISYIFHDSAYQNHGWWESADQGKTWAFVAHTEHDANDMLLTSAKIETISAKGYKDLSLVELGNLWVRREAMYAGVAIGGASTWDDHAGPFPNDPPPPFDVTHLFDDPETTLPTSVSIGVREQ